MRQNLNTGLSDFRDSSSKYYIQCVFKLLLTRLYLLDFFNFIGDIRKNY